MESMMHKAAPYLTLCLLALAPQGTAQTTCNTDRNGGTLCSTPEGVVRGYTSTLGDSVFRDEEGNRLEYEADQFGNSSVELPSGETINWSQTQNTLRDKLMRDIEVPDPRSNPPIDVRGVNPGPVPLGLGSGR